MNYLPLLLAIEKHKASKLDFAKTKITLLDDKFSQKEIDFIFSKFTFNSFTGTAADAKQKLNLLSTNNAKSVGEALMTDKNKERSESAAVDIAASNLAPGVEPQFSYTESFLNKLAISWWKWLGILVVINLLLYGIVSIGFPLVISYVVGNLLYVGVIFYFLKRK